MCAIKANVFHSRRLTFTVLC